MSNQETTETMRTRAATFRAFASHIDAWAKASTSDGDVMTQIANWRAGALKHAARWDEMAKLAEGAAP